MIYLHIDVDNIWMYEQEFGIKILADKEYIYKKSLPLFLKLLKKSGSKATFFIIGKDLVLPACRLFCKNAVATGHEIANHSWSHPITFGSLSYEQKKQEIIKNHLKLTKVCGVAPVGFRGPGYYQDPEIISVLQKLKYRYDSSVLPGFARVLMTTYAQLANTENRHKTFGRVDYLWSHSQPYQLTTSSVQKSIWELPISVLPLLRLPIHTTFAYFFGGWYRQLILRYLRSRPSYLLYLIHVIDLVNLGSENPTHPVIPLRYSFAERIQFIEHILEMLVEANGGPLQTSRAVRPVLLNQDRRSHQVPLR